MQAIFANDTQKGRGYGIIRVRPTSLPQSLDDCRFTVRRSKDKKCLIPGGWQDAETPLTPDAVSREAEALALCVGPAIVDQLDALETYRLTVIAPDGAKEAGILELTEVLYSPMRDAGTLQAVQTTPPPQPAPISAPASPPVEVETPPEKPEESLAPPPPPTPPRPRWPLLLAGGLLLLAAGAGAWYYFAHAHGQPSPSVVYDSDKPPHDQEHAGSADAAKAKSPEAKPGEQPPAAEVPPLDRARTFLRDKGPADQALELSRSMPPTPAGRDAAFLLLGYAAEGGQAAAMAAVARFYDPTDSEPTGSIRKDPEQAWHWYAKAKAAGQTGIQERLDGLTAWLRQQADNGDAAARELLDRLR